jgi:hypothetical protein
MTGKQKMETRGRKPKHEETMKNRMAFRLKEELWSDIVEICQREGITKTDFIVRAVEHEVKCNQRDYAVVEGFGDVKETEMNWSKIKQATREMLKAVERKGYH